MNTELKERLKYVDFHYEMSKNSNRKTSYTIEVVRGANQTSLTVDRRIVKYTGLVDELYLTPLKDRGYAVMSSNKLGDESIRLEFDKDTNASTDEESIVRFLTDVDIDMSELDTYVFENIYRSGSYAIIPL